MTELVMQTGPRRRRDIRAGRAILLAVAGGLLVGGCESLFRPGADTFTNDPVVNQGQPVARIPGRIEPFDLDTDCFVENRSEPDEEGHWTCSMPAYRLIRMARGEEQKRLTRDLMLILMRRSDSNCERHKAAILYVNSSLNTFSTAATGILSGVSAIVTGTLASQVLASTASGITVTQSAINEKVMFNIVAPAVVKKIDELRQAMRNQMLSKYSDGSKPDYPVDLMIADVERYNQACSFYSALAAIVNETKPAMTVAEIEARIANLRDQIDDNNTKISELPTGGGSTPASRTQVHQLELSNTLMNEKILVLQEQLNHAPITIGETDNGGGD